MKLCLYMIFFFKFVLIRSKKTSWGLRTNLYGWTSYKVLLQFGSNLQDEFT